MSPTNSADPFYGCLCIETYAASAVGAAATQVQTVAPEIHFNIWEESPGSPFLDVGLMLDINYPAASLQILLPWQIKPEEIEDLSERLLDANGISAIFNETWTSSRSTSSPGGYVTRAAGDIFSIVPYDRPVIRTFSHRVGDLHSISLEIPTLRALANAACPNSAGHQPRLFYVRFRVHNVPKSFYRVGIDQGDAFGGGALYSTEIIDFRLNVRRGAPPAIESLLNGKFVDFSKVQLFLMKRRDADIVFEDKHFRACRSLEDENFWAGYILPKSATTDLVGASLKRVKNSLGYQWKKTSDGAGTPLVSEFGMLARFKSFQLKGKTVALFLFIAILLGMAGNAAYDAAKYLVLGSTSDVAVRSDSRDLSAVTEDKAKSPMDSPSSASGAKASRNPNDAAKK